jgi:thymidylate synthase
MIAQVTGLKPGEFVHMLGDAHVYLNHIEPLKLQLARTPRPFPTLVLNKDVMDITAFKAEDVSLVGYIPHESISMKMAV